MSMRRSFYRYISDSFIVIYYAGAFIVKKVKHRNRKDSFSKIAMYIDAIFAFAWMCQYVSSISVFLVRMCFEGHLRHMTAIMWTILRIQNL